MPDIGGRQFSNGDVAVGGGLIVAFIAVFLPWYSASFNCNGIAACGSLSASAGGLSYWSGWLFFLAAIVGLALWIIRSFVPSVTLPQLPQSDANLYTIIGGFMVLMAILWWLTGSGATISGPGYSAGPSFGLYIGLVAAIVVAVGGYLMRSEPATARTLPVSSGTTYGGPPPAAPPAPPV